ncbi:MAG: hypothetical protein K2K94_05550 [Muribaculaceae bacterium]|nr:hypothetical protein [Muribaculaceae bacterium]
MKKLYYFLLLALPVMMFASCDDENSLPSVDVTIQNDGGVSVNDEIYVVQGDTLSVESINVVNKEHGKNAIITSATYSWDYAFVGVSVTPPYGAQFITENMPIGEHLLQIECPVYAVDKSPAMMYMAYKVKVVESVDDIPSGNQVTQFTTTPGIKES